MKSIRTAVIQMNSQPNLDLNLESAYQSIQDAAEQGATFIALPENFSFLGDEKSRLELAESIDHRVTKTLSDWAREFEISLFAGGYPVKAEQGKMYNRASLFNPDGTIAASYDKIHLFDVTLSNNESYRESKYVQSGKMGPVVCRTDKLPPVGFSICYDIRFPELYRLLTDRGAQIICIPAAFTKPTGKAHWEILLRSRAIENSCFIVAPAQTGRHGKTRETYGHSMIIDPWGTILVNAATEPGTAIADIDIQLLHDVRKKLPSINHRVL
jgi:deaminated glutathione amidase